MMPEIDGLTFCQKLKNDDKTCHIPIILLTARASKDNKLEGLECEADDYLVKPFDTPELLARVKNLIAQRRKLRERFSRELNLQPQKIAVSRRDEAFLEKLLGIFETHIDDETFGVGEIAAKIGWSRETAHRKIKALTGMTPKEFLYVFRLRRAEQLLRESDDTVTEIAYQTAFSSPAHLARRFKQKYGLSPLEYRQDKAQRSKGA